MQRYKLFDKPEEDIVVEKVFSIVPCGIIATADVYTQSAGTSWCFLQHLLTGSNYGRFEGEQVDNLLLVFQEEVIPTGFPSHYGYMPVRKHNLFFSTIVCSRVVELKSRNESPLSRIFGNGIGEEVVMGGVADVEMLEFVGKTHGHSRLSVFSTPSIEVSVL
jgi:hypothetical protein